MNAEFRKKVIFAYFVIVALGAVLSYLTYKAGNSAISASTPLLEDKLPILKNISKLQVTIMELEPILYEYYATMDRRNYLHRYGSTTEKIDSLLNSISHSYPSGAEIEDINITFGELLTLASKMDDTMNQRPVDWDHARELLVIISSYSNQVNSLLHLIVEKVEKTVLEGGETVVSKTNFMIDTVMLFSIVIFIISIFIAYYINIYFQELSERKRLAMFPERSPDSVSQFDIKGNIIYSNPSSNDILKKIDEDSDNIRLIFPDNLQSSFNHLHRSSEKMKRIEYERGDRILDCIIQYLNDLSIFHVHVVDITDRKRTEKALFKSEERYRTLYDNNPSVFFTLDPDGKVLSVNEYGANQLGYSPDDIINKSFFEFFHESDVTQARDFIKTVINNIEKLCHLEIRKRCNDGVYIWFRESARAVYSHDDELCVLLVSENITDAHNLSEELTYQANHDSLTGLINRRKFEQKLTSLLDNSRNDSGMYFLFYMDLDEFKVINDTCGHIAGDELLRQISILLKNNLRATDMIARMGGDEFVILIETNELDKAAQIAETLKQAIENYRFEFNGKGFRLSASIGVVPINNAGKSLNDILSLADTACYAAKDAGRNCVHIYDESDEEISERQGQMRWVSRINDAIQDDRFVLYFQRIVPVKGVANHDSIEILIRLRNENGETIPPGAFLPAAERYNLSGKLDQWVISRTFDWLRDNPEILSQMGHCGINLSGQSISDRSLLDFIRKEFSEKNIPYEKICFEITETSAIANLSSALELINNLRNEGCRFALDDFGSGLSSFAYLKNLPVDFLKIDGAFVKDIANNPIDHAMVTSINHVGKVMGMETIAEFVEDKQALKALQEIGVNYAQGFGIAIPKAISEYQPPVLQSKHDPSIGNPESHVVLKFENH